MNDGPSPAEPTTDTSLGLPSQGVRTVVSLLLFIHLFALGVAVVSNKGELSSPLQRQLRSVPLLMDYLQFLDMDMPYNFDLTQGELLDIDHVVLVDLTLADGTSQQVVLPDDTIRPRTRRLRYLKLADNMAFLTGDPDREGLLPGAVAGAIMNRYGVNEATITCRGQYLLTAEDVGSSDLTRRDPYHPRRFRTVYEARALRSDGQVGLVKTSSDELPGATSRAPSSTAPPPVESP